MLAKGRFDIIISLWAATQNTPSIAWFVTFIESMENDKKQPIPPLDELFNSSNLEVFSEAIHLEVTKAVLKDDVNCIYQLLNIVKQSRFTFCNQQNLFRHIFAINLSTSMDPNEFFQTLLNTIPGWFEPLIVEEYSNAIATHKTRHGEESPLNNTLNNFKHVFQAWPEKDRVLLLTKIFQKLAQKFFRFDITLETWADALNQSFRHDKDILSKISLLFWQTLYDAYSPDLHQCDKERHRLLRLYIILRHRDTVKEEYGSAISLDIFRYINELTVYEVQNFLKDENILAQYRYLCITQQAFTQDIMMTWVKGLDSQAQLGFTSSKSYKVKQCNLKIENSLALLEHNTDRLENEDRFHFEQACMTFNTAHQRYQSGELPHSELRQSLSQTFDTEDMKRILSTHSEWYQILLEIAINIVVIGSLVGLITLAAYRYNQGFQHGFFIHTETSRQRLQKELNAATLELPTGMIYDNSY